MGTQMTRLDDFGKWFMTEVRDHAIHAVSRLMDEQRNLKPDLRLRALMGGALTERDKQLISLIGPLIVDITLDNVLSALQEAQSVFCVVGDSLTSAVDIRSISDGLAGELYTEKGWIEKFSQQPLNFDDQANRDPE
jgi:hypothetical protein